MGRCAAETHWANILQQNQWHHMDYQHNWQHIYQLVGSLGPQEWGQAWQGPSIPGFSHQTINYSRAHPALWHTQQSNQSQSPMALWHSNHYKTTMDHTGNQAMDINLENHTREELHHSPGNRVVDVWVALPLLTPTPQTQQISPQPPNKPPLFL